MSTSHRVIIDRVGVIKLNTLHVIQSVLTELKSNPKVRIIDITVDKDSMSAFNIHFQYGDEKRTLFVCEGCDVYYDTNDHPIDCELYFNLNVWGSNVEIMNIVKSGIRKATRIGGVYESVNDALEHRFEYVLGE